MSVILVNQKPGKQKQMFVYTSQGKS